MSDRQNINNIFPRLPDSPHTPKWVGNGFQVGDQLLHILSYDRNTSGWTDDLTTFHEETAGSSHFIDNASRQQAVMQLKKYCTSPHPVILDIGCSSGFLIDNIRAEMPNAFVIGTDVVMGPLTKLAAAHPEIPLMHFDLTTCPLPDNSVDAVVLLNVLEHIENDALAVSQLFRILKPGGAAVVEVPAGPELFDVYDELLMHYRRYKIKGLADLFLNAGFYVPFRSHMGFFLYPGFFVIKQLQRNRWKNISEEEKSALVAKNINQTGGNPIFRLLMEFELFIGNMLSYPFGIRCLLVAQKTS